MKKLLMMGALGLLLAAGTGCSGADCESLCEDAGECPGGDASNCADSCADADALNSASGCGSQADAVLDCQADKDDICSADGCESEGEAYSACIVEYCTANPDASECMASSGG